MSLQNKIKINFCAPTELLHLPGIGKNLCDAILDLRESKGNLRMEDLAQVRHLNVTPQLLQRIDFEPYDLESSEISQSEQIMPMLSRIDQAIANVNLRVPPAHYLAPVSPSLSQPDAVYLTSLGRPTDIGLQLGKACYPRSG